MRYSLRKRFDTLVALLPTPLLRGALKTFDNHPELALKCGFRLFPTIFDSPLVAPAEIDVRKLSLPRTLPGIPIDLEYIADLVSKIAPFQSELNPLPGTDDPQWAGTYTIIDSTALYCMLRHLKPRRFIEVGCGYSSRVSSMALRKNTSEGHPCEATYIEPFPGWRLEGVDLYGELLQKRIEEVPPDYFDTLGPNDVFFIDTSHVIKTQSDVEHELLRILPILKAGVHVQVHDIYTPYDQPSDCVLGLGHGNYWGFRNEQYALECLLSCSDSFKVSLPLYLLEREYPDLLESVVPGRPPRAQAFWFVKR